LSDSFHGVISFPFSIVDVIRYTPTTTPTATTTATPTPTTTPTATTTATATPTTTNRIRFLISPDSCAAYFCSLGSLVICIASMIEPRPMINFPSGNGSTSLKLQDWRAP